MMLTSMSRPGLVCILAAFQHSVASPIQQPDGVPRATNGGDQTACDAGTNGTCIGPAKFAENRQPARSILQRNAKRFDRDDAASASLIGKNGQATTKVCSNCGCQSGGWLGSQSLNACAASCSSQGWFKHASGTTSSGGHGDNNCACCTNAATTAGDDGWGVDVYARDDAPTAALVTSLVSDKHHCAHSVNLRVAGIWQGGTLQHCAQVAAGTGLSHGCSAGHK